jgi:hypothetical protein
MLTALEDDYHPSHLTPPFAKGHSVWAHERIPQDTSSWTLTGSCHNNPGLAAPNTNQPFALAEWARYMLYHGCPGTPNQFVGVAFNYALQVHYRSVFVFQLAWALCPTSPSGQASFIRHFAGIVAMPGCYAEYLAKLAAQPSPTESFISSSGSVTLTWMDLGEHHGPNLTINEVLATLTTNHIPLTWVDHAYTYGLHYLNHHYNHSPEAEANYREVDNEHIHWLGVHDLPPAIPEWDRWYNPTVEDVGRVHMLQAMEEDRDHYCLNNSHDWLLVGEDPHFNQLFA